MLIDAGAPERRGVVYLYDGSFEGFLTCVYEHYYSGVAGAIFPPGAYQPDMFAAPRTVRTDAGKAGKVEAAIREKLSPHALARVYRVFRTSVADREMLLLNYLRFCFRRGPGAAFLHTHPLVLPVDTAERKIANEVHRLCGLIRFSEVAVWSGTGEEGVVGRGAVREEVADAAGGGAAKNHEILYARVSPDHDVLEFIAPHFVDRFKNEPFIIHDTMRGRAVFAWRRRWHIADFTEEDAALLSRTTGEEAYRTLWRGYFEAMAIKERTNPRCQRNLMPARYWRDLPEMQVRS
jgi:probable DNA metabolism protein